MSKIVESISAVFRSGVRYRTDRLEPLGISSRQGAFLLDICAQPGISQDALARRGSINKSNVTRQVSALEEMGYISRRGCDKDKRVMRLYPTEKALAIEGQIRSVMESWNSALTEALTGEEQAQLAALLDRLRTRAAEIAGEE